MNKKICMGCGLEKNEDNFYPARDKFENRLKICSHCMAQEIVESDYKIEKVLRKYNIPFIINVYESIGKDAYIDLRFNSFKVLNSYMQIINNDKYINLTWKDSIFDKKEFEEKFPKTFEENIIDNLQNELKFLNEKLIKTRESGDFGTYKNLIQAYKEILLIYYDTKKTMGII